MTSPPQIVTLVGSRAVKVARTANAVEQTDQVALEVSWPATLLVPLGSISAGGTLRAHFGVILRFRDGPIVAQSNYDCFDPF